MVAKPWTAERLLERLSRSDDPDGCWLWIGSAWNGYGNVRVDGKYWKAHRLAYRLFVGPIPHGLDVLHTCDNPPCCNPAHLFTGDQLANMQDRKAKGRYKQPRGSAHGRAKLTEDDVREIRRLVANGVPQNELAKRYGITPTSLGLAVHRKTWKHVE